MAHTAVEVPRNTWKQFFNDLDRQYEGWAVTVEVLAGELGDQHALDGLPLQGLSFDAEGSQAGDILVEAGDAGTAFGTHLIHKPRAVRAAQVQLGAEADIEIEDDEGTVHVIRIRRRPQLPRGR